MEAFCSEVLSCGFTSNTAEFDELGGIVAADPIGDDMGIKFAVPCETAAGEDAVAALMFSTECKIDSRLAISETNELVPLEAFPATFSVDVDAVLVLIGVACNSTTGAASV